MNCSLLLSFVNRPRNSVYLAAGYDDLRAIRQPVLHRHILPRRETVYLVTFLVGLLVGSHKLLGIVYDRTK